MVTWAVIIVNTPYFRYANLPDDAIQGFGLGRVFLWSGAIREFLFSTATLLVTQWSAIGLCAGALLWPRSVAIIRALSVAVFILDASTKAVGGFANHAQTAPMLLLIAFAIFARCPYLSLSELLRREPSPQRLTDKDDGDTDAVAWLALSLILLPYTFIGLNRLVNSGLSIFTSEALLVYFAVSSDSFSSYPEWLDIHALSLPLRAGFAFTTLAEVAAPLVLVLPRFRTLWLGIMIFFHLLTLAFMNIFFWENLFLSLVAFWPGWQADVGVPSAPPSGRNISRVAAQIGFAETQQRT